MKKRWFILTLFMFLVTQYAYADVYVILNEDNSIYTVSSQNDTVLNEGQRVVMYEGKLPEFCDKLPAHPSLCRLVNKKFIYDSTLEPKKPFNNQKCQKDLYSSFLPNISQEDMDILQKNSSLLIITKCLDFNNKDSWDTLKEHINVLKNQGISNDTINLFKQIVKSNNYDLDGGE
jgi:hypothetical protein